MNTTMLTALAVTWTVCLSAGATAIAIRFLRWVAEIRLARRNQATEKNLLRIKHLALWATLGLTPLTVGAALLDMEEYWRDGLLGRELMWETRWESEKVERMRYRDISAFLAERLPNDMHEAAEVLQEDAKFTELDPTTASEIRKLTKASKFEAARRKYHTPKPLDESWQAIAQQKVERHRNGYEIDDYKVRRFIRVIDGDWRFVVRDTQILVYLRQSKTNGVDVVGTRQWLPLLLRGP